MTVAVSPSAEICTFMAPGATASKVTRTSGARLPSVSFSRIRTGSNTASPPGTRSPDRATLWLSPEAMVGLRASGTATVMCAAAEAAPWRATRVKGP